jgi:hypothetical protein
MSVNDEINTLSGKYLHYNLCSVRLAKDCSSLIRTLVRGSSMKNLAARGGRGARTRQDYNCDVSNVAQIRFARL